MFASGSVLSAQHKGFYRLQRSVVGTPDNLVLKMQRGGSVTGKVVQLDGKPAAASVQVLLVTDMQSLAVELYQYAADGG